MNISDHIRASGLSRGEICQRVGISRGMLSLIESGKRQAGLNRAARLAEAIGVTVDVVRPDLAHVMPKPSSDAA